jgi:hypothetical protein
VTAYLRSASSDRDQTIERLERVATRAAYREALQIRRELAHAKMSMPRLTFPSRLELNGPEGLTRLSLPSNWGRLVKLAAG